MKILIISPDTSGTIANLSYNLCRAFLFKGDNVVKCLCLSGRQDEVPDDIDVTLLPKFDHGIFNKLKSVLSRIRCIRRIVRKHHIELSISTLLGCSFWNILSSTKEDFKMGIFHTDPGQSIFHGSVMHRLYQFMYSCVVPRLDALIAVNMTAKKHWNLNMVAIHI